MSDIQFICATLILVTTTTGCGTDQNSAVREGESPTASMKEMSSQQGVDANVDLRSPIRLGWPLFEGYPNPNLIVYDKARFDRYVAYYVTDRTFLCSPTSRRSLAIDGRTASLGTGFDDENAVRRFHLDHLRKFLRSRISGTTQAYSDDEALKKLAPLCIMAPYEKDVCECIDLIRSGGAIEALPELDALLSDREVRVRASAIWAIKMFGPAASASVPNLVELLETELASNASRALAAIGPEAVAALTKKASSGGTDARIYAIDALGLIGPAAATSVDELIQALYEKKDAQDHSGYISSYAAEALGHIGDRRALPHLRKMASAENGDVQHISAAAISEIEGGPRFQRH